MSIPTTSATVPKVKLLFKRKGQRTAFRRNNLVGYLFISPWLTGFILFSLIPIIVSLGLAFSNFRLLKHDIFSATCSVHTKGDFSVSCHADWKYTKLENFERMFYHDVRYWKSVRATGTYVAYAVPLRLAFALAVAMLLNTKRHGVYFYRAAFYVPSVVGGSVAVAVMWRQIFGDDGLVNAVLGTDTLWFGDPDRVMWTLISLAIWQFGSPMLIFLAGLRQIPPEYYEAASIDGANSFQRFRKITLPLLTPIIFFNVVMQTIHAFQQFTQAFIITGRGPLDRTLLYPLYVYQRGFVNNQMGYASAMAWVLLAVIAFCTAILFISSRYWVYYQGDER